MKKLLFIYNLHAGKGALRGRLSPILDELTREWDVTVHPTRGLDIGATRYVHDTMIEAREAGCGVLLISADFDEILEMSDRIVVMFEGRILGEYDGKNPPIEEISLAMAGK